MAAPIKSITGLQNLTNLQDFRADWNSLISVNFSGLTNLTYIDISDCEDRGSGTESLTSINLTGCTALEELRVDDSDFSAGIPNLSGLTSLDWIDMDQCSISGDVNLSMLPALRGFDLSGNTGITSVVLSEQVLDNVDISNAALTEASINNILAVLDNGGLENGSALLSGGTNSHPTGNGVTAKANLISKGWNVETNSAPPGRVGIAASTDFDIVGDFTIEMFVNLSNTNGFPRAYSFGVYPAANAISFENGTLYFWGNNAIRVSGNFDPTLGEWYHICVQRSGTDLQLFVDGILIGSETYGDDISSQTLPLTIGYGNEADSGFNGLMSNFRWTSAAVHSTAGFTVPTAPLTDLAGTKLLIFQGNDLTAQLVDNSGNNHNATNTGATFSTNDPANSAAGSLQMGNV